MMLLDKIVALKKKFLDGGGDAIDIGAIESWYDEAKRLLLLKSLKDQDGVKYVIEIFQGEVKKINAALLKSDSTEMPDKVRDRYIDRRDLAQKYLALFVSVEDDLEKLEDAVDKE